LHPTTEGVVMKNLKHIILPFAFLFTLSFAQDEAVEESTPEEVATEEVAPAPEEGTAEEATTEEATQEEGSTEAPAEEATTEEATQEEGSTEAPAEEATTEETTPEEVATEEVAPAPEEGTAEEATTEETTPEEGSTEAPAEEEHHVSGGSPLAGFSFGVAPSIGLISGETFTNIPVGATVVITTPYGFKVGPLDFTISAAFGGYAGKFDEEAFNPTIAGVGGNLVLANLVFAEGHAGMIGSGQGVRGFAGVSLEYLMKKGLNLPVNILVGGEGFISNDMAGVGNPSFWGGLGVRLDYDF
jgi:hypothetical protein